MPCSAMAALIRKYLAVSPGEASSGGSSLAMLLSGVQSNAISTGREFEPLDAEAVLLFMVLFAYFAKAAFSSSRSSNWCARSEPVDGLADSTREIRSNLCLAEISSPQRILTCIQAPMLVGSSWYQ